MNIKLVWHHFMPILAKIDAFLNDVMPICHKCQKESLGLAHKAFLGYLVLLSFVS
jgi:hypothetical protein